MNRIWRFYRRRIDLYLLLGFLGLAVVTIGFKLNYLAFFISLFSLTISPAIFYLIFNLSARIFLVNRVTKIPRKCRQCRWYYGTVCQISPQLQENCLDFQY